MRGSFGEREKQGPHDGLVYTRAARVFHFFFRRGRFFLGFGDSQVHVISAGFVAWKL